MIVKHGQKIPGLQRYVRRTQYVHAKRMASDFQIETDRGWHAGKRGDWLVLVGDDLWCAIADTQFRRIYHPAEEAV